VSPPRRSEGGVPGMTRKLATLPGIQAVEESWAGANQAKDEKLRVRSLQRRAGAQGFELRHSDYGYALIGTEGKPVGGGRIDLTLKEIESLLAGAIEQ
jgi:hypothetical protein